MNSQYVVAEFDSLKKARTALQVLAKNDYREEHVSYIAHSTDPELNILQNLLDENEREPGPGAGASAGSLLGGALATPLAAGTLIGPLILVGPLVAVGLGASLGSFLGISKGGDMNNDTAHPNYIYRIEHGGAVILGTGRDSELRDMEALLKTADALSIKRLTLPSSDDEMSTVSVK